MDRKLIVGIVAGAIGLGLAAGLFLPRGGPVPAPGSGSGVATARPIMYEFSSDT